MWPISYYRGPLSPTSPWYLLQEVWKLFSVVCPLSSMCPPWHQSSELDLLFQIIRWHSPIPGDVTKATNKSSTSGASLVQQLGIWYRAWIIEGIDSEEKERYARKMSITQSLRWMNSHSIYILRLSFLVNGFYSKFRFVEIQKWRFFCDFPTEETDDCDNCWYQRRLPAQLSSSKPSRIF